jgi:uncharacterized membrane protein YbhN (UPF0104 family)
MSLLGPIVFSTLLTGVILLLAAREVALYRKDQATRADIYPYTKGRLVRRLVVSACLVAEVLLLALIRLTLSPAHPLWFLIYVGIVLLFVVVMVVMAILDLRESVKLRKWSMERLWKEFVHEVRSGGTPPETQ